MTDPSDMLARICAETRTETARRCAAISFDAMRKKADAADPPRGFARELMEATARGGIGLIAELKKSSPSGGLIRPDFDAAAIAREYAAAGATCLSVLTDGPHFQGSIEHLKAARAAVELPVLRKDFILEPWQVYESRAMGADAVLLILAALTDEEATLLERTARDLGMDVLAEVHNHPELDRALGLQTPLIGINNRNLKTLETNIATTIALAPDVSPGRFLVSESGIRSRADIDRLMAAGASCYLIGEWLLRQPDIGAAVRALLAPAA